ncbi:MAG: ABC transporter permease [Actinomyces sp.]|jgi:predicted lysophospholipase L1 biosynthesis ABC-type transport system permease subunit|nr:ABC transporter permease [Actinomyces sp.]MCI1662016.1 ABC transporter permease [Actinomyces sp.]MCI1690784.1 ABC transporter permease [Actinomyces sp.]
MSGRWPDSPNAVVSRADLVGDAGIAGEGLEVLDSSAFINALPGYSAQVLTFSLMIGSLIVIASFVLGIFIYVLTLQKRPVLGMLKARGVPTGYLIVSGAAQTALLSAVGVAIGLFLTSVSALALPPGGALPRRRPDGCRHRRPVRPARPCGPRRRSNRRARRLARRTRHPLPGGKIPQ